MVENHPISAKDESMLHQPGKKVLPGIFLGYALVAGEGASGREILQTRRSWEHWTRQKSTLEDSRVNNSMFLFADGTAKLQGDHEIRESTLRQYDPVGSEDLSEEFQENSDELQPAETKEDTEPRNDLW